MKKGNEKRKEFIDEVSNYLEKQGYIKPEIDDPVPSCVEIQRVKNGERYYFSIMAITKNKWGKYFDATHSNEWKEVIRHKSRFFFVIVRKDVEDPDKRVKLLKPETILAYSRLYPLSVQVKLEIPSASLDEDETMRRVQYSLVDKLVEIINGVEKLNTEVESIKKEMNNA